MAQVLYVYRVLHECATGTVLIEVYTYHSASATLSSQTGRVTHETHYNRQALPIPPHFG
jgi:hypothetical protein